MVLPNVPRPSHGTQVLDTSRYQESEYQQADRRETLPSSEVEAPRERARCKTHRGHGPKVAATRTPITIAAKGITSEMKTNGNGPMYEMRIPMEH